MSSYMTKEEAEEREHFRKIIAAFRSYRRDSRDRIQRSWNSLRRLPPDQQRQLKEEGFEEGLKRAEECVDANYKVVQGIIRDIEGMFENVDPEDRAAGDGENGLDGEGEPPAKRPARRTDPRDADKVQSTLKQFVRDWSKEGAAEREMCYGPIMKEILEIYGKEGEDRSKVKVLVPGAGLGRLAFDIAKAGFECQGNEFSLFMLAASNFVLNRCTGMSGSGGVLHPWVHQVTNVVSRDDQFAAISFPDVDPGSLAEGSRFSMAAGDFLEVYSEPEYESSQDCVATCFFLDCARNVLDFIRVIRRVLKPGGHWINFGPLLYHFADMPGELSVEPSYEEVLGLVRRSGFAVLKEEQGLKCTYTQNPRSMLQFTHQCVFFTCRKDE